MKRSIQLKSLLLIFVLLISTLTPYTVDAATFTDISTTDSRYLAINWAVENGYMEKRGTRFMPNEAVTEAELLKVLAAVDGNYAFSQTDDMRYNHYSSIYIPLKGTFDKSKNTVRNQPVTRVEFARIYAATQRYDLTNYHAVQYLYANEISYGDNLGKTYAAFQPANVLTRGDLAVFLYRSVSKAKGNFLVHGLMSSATGKDDVKVTLPNNFLQSDGTVDLEQPEYDYTNDPSNHPNTFKAVQSIIVTKQELLANGVDSSLIKIKLKDGYGNTIPNDKSLEFRVTSENGALFSATGNGQSTSLTTVYSDGGELSVFVTAPKSTKSVVDTVRFQLINNNEKNYEVYKNKTIDVKLRYVPKAELRLTYEIYDPNQPNAGGNVDSGIKPLPALPQGFTPDGGLITLNGINEDAKLFNGEKVETYEQPNGTSVTQPLVLTDIQYENANLEFAKHRISVWLFEQLYKEFYNNMATFGVTYTIDDEGRATYNYPSYMEPNFMNQFESDSHAVLIYLMKFIPGNKRDITMIHYDSVKALKAIFDSFSVTDQNKLREQFKTEIANLDAANAAVNSLKESQIIADRPANMERYTKIIASLVAPGGQIITDFKGTVEIEFNGKRRTVGFTTNTTSYNPETGHGGAAVVYFDDIIYGYSDVKAKIVSMDDRYEKMVDSLLNQEVTEKVFTNSKFEKNMCSLVTEIAYVMDQSMSMRKIDPTNFIAAKTTELIAQMGSENSIAIRSSSNSYVQTKGQAIKVAATEGLFNYVAEDTKATNISSGLQVALNNFSNNAETAKAIILVSDGKSTQTQLQSILTQAESAGVKIYTITVGKSADVNVTQMKRIANETGGQHYHVVDVKNLHSTYQAIIDTVLCETYISDASCENPARMFDEAKVTIGRSFVSMNGEVLPNCDMVKVVEVRFIANGGELVIPLIHRGEQIYRTSTPIRQFSNFSLYTQVEFVAYDKDGKLVGLKQVRVQ